MKKIHLVILTIICLLGTAACGGSRTDKDMSFKDLDLAGVTRIEVKDMHTGTQVSLTEKKDVASIVSFINGTEGTGAESGKGYYEGTYSVVLYADDDSICAVGFGDSDCFFYGKGDDGYPIRYALTGRTIKGDVVPFFEQFFD